MEINRRLNDLLNDKDEEIMRLSQQVMTFEEGNSGSPNRSGKKGTAIRSPKGASLVKGYGAVTEMENKLLDHVR